MGTFVSEKFKWFYLFIVWLLFCGGVVLFIFLQPAELSLSLDSNQICLLRVYHSSTRIYHEKRTLQESVTPFKNQYRFSLPRKTRRIRLDLLGVQPGYRITVRNMALVRHWLLKNDVQNPDSTVLQPVKDIVCEGNGRFKVTGARPQLQIAQDFMKSRKLNLRYGSLAVLIFLLGGLVVLQIRLDAGNSPGKPSVNLVEGFQTYCSANKWFLVYVFSCLILLFGYELFNLPISEDDDWNLLHDFELYENSMPAAYSFYTYPSLQDNYLAHGRWSRVVCLKIFTGFCPVFSMLWCLICMSAVFLVLAEKLSIPKTAKFLLFPLFIANPVFYEYFQFFMMNNIYGLICLIAFLAAVFWPRCRNWQAFFLLVFAAVFAVNALESLILLFPLWFILSKISDSLDNKIDYKQSAVELLKLCGVAILVLAGYVLSLKYSLWLFDVKWQYLGDYLQKPDSLKAFLLFGKALLQKMYSVYSGEFQFAVHGQLLLVLLMVGAVIVRLIRKKRCILDIAAVAVALAAVLILPFTLDIVSFNIFIPVRSMTSFPVLMVGLCILGWRALEDCPRVRIAAGLLIVYVAVQYGILINQKAYASKLRHDQDMAVLQSIKDRCYQIPEFISALNEQKKIPLAVVGNLMTPKYRAFPMWNNSLLNCTFEPAVVVNLHLLGETYFYPVSTGEMKRIVPAAMAMPVWPAPGSVRYLDGVMIVKLSEFTPEQCKQFGFPFHQVSRGHYVYRLDKFPADGKPVWSLTPETLASTDNCTVDFSGKRITVKPFEWHSLKTKPIKADPDKIYFLQLKMVKKNKGYLYVGFSHRDKNGDEIMAEISAADNDGNCIGIMIPGRYLNAPMSVLLGDLFGKEQIFDSIALFELSGGIKSLLAP